MQIAIIGYGKMGETIEALSRERGHQIAVCIDADSTGDEWKKAEQADVAIEFTNPTAAPLNIKKCLQLGLPVVSGSTGWYEKLSDIEALVSKHNGALLYASNFSIGVNIFMEVNRVLASLMNGHTQYEVTLSETHHTEKLDAPSGTAITLAEQTIEALDRKNKWVEGIQEQDNELLITAHRKADVKGTHKIKYTSDVDEVELIHRAHSRNGFALGALTGAEWLVGKKGTYTMKDVLKLNQHP